MQKGGEEGMEEMIKILSGQLKLLVDWNKEHIKVEPEQVRKNVETILQILKAIQEFNS